MKTRKRNSGVLNERRYFLRRVSTASSQPLNIDFITELPVELSLLIFSFIPPRSHSIRHIAQCSKYCNILVSDHHYWLKHLEHRFPHLMHSVFCIRSYLDRVTPLDAIQFLRRREIGDEEVEDWVERMQMTELLIPPDRESRWFFEWLDEFSRFRFPMDFVLDNISFDFLIRIEDISFLRWLVCMSGFNKRVYIPSPGPNALGFKCTSSNCDIRIMNRIAESFPEESSVLVTRSESHRIPVCTEYVDIEDISIFGEPLPSDLTFENVANHPLMTIKGVRFSCVPCDIVARCMSSIRQDILTHLHVHMAGIYERGRYLLSLLSMRLEEMTSLRVLKLEFNHEISTALLESICTLTKLEVLSLCSLFGFTEIPKSIEKLTNLTQFRLHDCFELVRLPSAIGNLKNLRQLIMSDCHSLIELPSSICNLERLSFLDLTRCDRIAKEVVTYIRSSLPNCAVLEPRRLSYDGDEYLLFEEETDEYDELDGYIM